MRRAFVALILLWPALTLAGSAYNPPRTATATSFTPSDGAAWTDPDPTTLQSAVDTLAARVPAAGALGGSTGVNDNRVLRSDGVGGATLQASDLICDDSGNLSGVAGLTMSGNITLSTPGATVDGVDVGQLYTDASAEFSVSQSGTGACDASKWASTLNSDAAPTCTQPAFSDLSGAATDAQVPNNITVDLAATATALAANPTACSGGEFVTDIAADGTLTCAAAGGSDASSVTFTPTDNTDWTGSADPGNADDALDQLAQRVTDGAVNGTTVTLTDGQTYTVAAGVGMVLANCSSGSSTINLPAASTFTGKRLTIKIATGGSSYGVSLNASTVGGTTIDGSAGVLFYGPNATRTVWSNGTAYYVAATHSLPDGLVGASNAVPYYTGVGGLSTFTATQGGRALAGVSWSSGTQIPALTAAATTTMLTVGTGNNNIVQRDGSGNYPSGNGSAITSVAAATAAALASNPSDCGAGTVATGIAANGDLTCGYTVGTGASNLVQRDGSGNYPSGDGSALTNITGAYPPDSWDYEWNYADGDPLSAGWAQGSARSVTTAAVTTGLCATHNCYSITPSGTSGTSYLKYASTGASGSWELRMRVGISATTAVNLGFGYNPEAAASGTKLPFYGLQTGGLAWWNGSMSSMGSYGSFVGQLVDVTIRAYNSGDGTTYNWMETWIGPVLVDSRVASASWQAQTTAGEIIIGRLAASTDAHVHYINRVQLKHSGVNAAPPSYTFRAQAYPL